MKIIIKINEIPHKEKKHLKKIEKPQVILQKRKKQKQKKQKLEQ